MRKIRLWLGTFIVVGVVFVPGAWPGDGVDGGVCACHVSSPRISVYAPSDAVDAAVPYSLPLVEGAYGLAVIEDHYSSTQYTLSWSPQNSTTWTPFASVANGRYQSGRSTFFTYGKTYFTAPSTAGIYRFASSDAETTRAVKTEADAGIAADHLNDAALSVIPDGEFEIISWTGYRDDFAPRPSGTLRLRTGSEYIEAARPPTARTPGCTRQIQA